MNKGAIFALGRGITFAKTPSPFTLPQSVSLSLSLSLLLTTFFSSFLPLSTPFFNSQRKKKKINIGRLNLIGSTTLHPSKIPCNFCCLPSYLSSYSQSRIVFEEDMQGPNFAFFGYERNSNFKITV